ncbi:hypothetical protein [Legionella parisiensis]
MAANGFLVWLSAFAPAAGLTGTGD